MKKLLMIPADLSLLLVDGLIPASKLSNVAMAHVSCSVPLVNDAIVSVAVNSHVTSEVEQSKITTKNDMSSNTKNILVDIGNEESVIEDLMQLTTEASILAYLNTNNKLIYLASTASLLTNNVIDIYYHTVDKCLYISPELSHLGSPIVFNGINIEIDLYRIAPLELKATFSSTIFHGDNKYFPDMEFKPDALDLTNGIGIAKTDITAYTMLLQGLNHYALKSEYSRNTEKNGTANAVFADSMVHIIVLDELASNLLKDNLQVRQGLIIQATPYEWRLKGTGKTNINRLAFPLRF